MSVRPMGRVMRCALDVLTSQGGEADMGMAGADSTSTNLALFRLEQRGLIEKVGPARTSIYGRWRIRS